MKCYYTGALDIGQPCTWATGSPATRDEQSGVSIMLRPGVRQGTATGRIAAPNTSRGRCNRGVRMGIVIRTLVTSGTTGRGRGLPQPGTGRGPS